jgi:predicted MFS family arabinose efflux permease
MQATNDRGSLRMPPLWALMLAGTGLAAIGGGARATFGLFLDPVVATLDADRAMYGLAIAIQAIVWGIGQPIAGAVADRFGAARVLAFGAVMYSAGLFVMGASTNSWTIHASTGFMVGVGMAAASFSVVLASVSRLVPEERRSWALGVTTAFTTAGQVVMIPVTQWLIDEQGWRTAAVFLGVLLAVMLVATPLFRGNANDQNLAVGVTEEKTPLSHDLRKAMHSRGFLLLNAAFFVCGFHVTFIATHLKSYTGDLGQAGSIAAWALVLIGLFNMAGSYAAGVLGGRHSKTQLLAIVYGLRAVVIAVFVLWPASGTSTLIFGAAIGLLWLTTVPLTSGIVAQQFGTANAGALFGIVFLGHQIGAFIGAWLGGYLADTTGSYLTVWWISVALGVFAAVVHLFLDEGPAPEPPAPGGARSRVAPVATAVLLGLVVAGLAVLAAPAADASQPAVYCGLHVFLAG